MKKKITQRTVTYADWHELKKLIKGLHYLGYERHSKTSYIFSVTTRAYIIHLECKGKS